MTKDSSTAKPGSGFQSFRELLSLTNDYKGKFYLSVVLTIIVAFMGPVRPYLMQIAVDRYIATGDAAGLVALTILIFSLLLVQSAIQVWATILSNLIGQEVIHDLRNSVYHYLTSLRIRFYDQTPVGTLVTRTVNDIETIADIFSEGLINISGDLLQIVFILILMFWTDWKLSLISLSVLPFLIYAGYVFKENVRTSFEEVRNMVARLNSFVQEHIQGMQVVQIFGRQEQEYTQFRAINVQHRDANIRSVWYYSVFFPVVELIAAVSTALILWYGSRGVLDNSTSIGTMIAFTMYVGLFFRPIRQLADRFNNIQMGMVASNRIFKLIGDTSQVAPTGTLQPAAIRGEIEFRHVTFGYKPEEPVLHDISFKVDAGKTLALVGATGSGKTSITSLIHQFYQAQKGEIWIDQVPVGQYDAPSLRRHTGTVLQDVFLFSGTVAENIRMFNPVISVEKIIATSKMLGAHDFISKLPHGYDQEVNERGLTLSVGQRQLISFVRAMVTDPSILILDEATASIDHETEITIRHAIDRMLMGRTCLIIAHRLSTIQHADQILVMDKGRIAEQGTHAELMERGGLYKKLYEVQFSKELD